MPSFNALDDVLSRIGLARQSRRRERPLAALQVLGDGQHRAELSIENPAALITATLSWRNFFKPDGFRLSIPDVPLSVVPFAFAIIASATALRRPSKASGLSLTCLASIDICRTA